MTASIESSAERGANWRGVYCLRAGEANAPRCGNDVLDARFPMGYTTTRGGVMFRGAAAVLLFPFLVLSFPPTCQGQKAEKWIEVRSPNFVVVTNGNAKQGQRIADQFEQIRAVFETALPKARVDPGKPVVIMAAKDEKTLKALLPAFWEKKGRVRPAGIFQAGEEKHYVALRLDVTGERPYHTIYHEYVHLLVNLNFRRVPVWLNEGLAEFYANTTVEEKEVLLGRANAASLEVLRSSRLLPLEVLLTADHNSPHYTEENKASLFYAESWVLVHHMMVDEKMRAKHLLSQFVALIENEVEDLEAARRVFGDLKQLTKSLEAYARQEQFFAVKLKPPANIQEKDYATRELAPAESAAIRGDFYLYTGRPSEARARLEEALRLDPMQAQAHASLGLLHFRQGAREEAAEHFEQAVKLDARSYLAHYFHAMLAVKGILSEANVAQVERDARRAIELNPNFAPAYALLASFLAVRKENLQEALVLAQKAAALEPGTLPYQLNVANVLMLLERMDEAVAHARRVLAASRTEGERKAAEVFLSNAQKYQTYLAEKRRQDDEARRAVEEVRQQLKEERREVEETPPSGKDKAKVGEASGQGAAAPPEITAPGEGRVVALSCTDASLDLTLDYYGFVLKLHAEDVAKITYTPTRWQRPKNFNPCVHLKGLRIRTEYKAVAGKPYAGEIVSIAVQP